MSLSHTIDDGYTRDGYVKEAPGFHPALSFRYRPMLAHIRQEYLFQLRVANESRDAAELTGLCCDVLENQLESLSVTDSNGKTVKVLDAGQKHRDARGILQRLEPNLQVKLRDICLGVVPSDVAPDGSKQNGRAPHGVDRDALTRRMIERAPAPSSHTEAELIAEGHDAGN